MTSQSILDAILAIGRQADCEGVFVSCTSLRVAHIISQAEAQLGKPVIASNQALAWHLLRLAGVEQQSPQFGALFEHTL